MYEIPYGWEWTNFQTIIKSIKYGYTAKTQDTGNIKFLRITDIKNGYVDLTTVPYCEITNSEFKKYKIETDDILIARSGSVGKSFIVPEITEPVVYASYLIRLRLLNKKLLSFIRIYLESPLYWTQLNNTSFGNVLKNVNSNSLKSLLIPIPPLKEQSRIITLVDQVMDVL